MRIQLQICQLKKDIICTYRDETGRLEMDFFVRDTNYLIPVEVKASDNSTISLNNLIDNDKYKDIKYGIKLCNKNIGFNGKFYTFPYFLTFLLKRYLNEKIYKNKYKSYFKY